MLNVCLLLAVKVRQLRLGQFDSPRFNSAQFNSSQKKRELGEVRQVEGGRRGLGATAEPAPRLFLRWDSPLYWPFLAPL